MKVRDRCMLALATALATALALPALAGAQDGSSGAVALGAKIGTLGLGAEVTVKVIDSLNLRGGGAFLDFSHADDISDIEYDADIEFQTWSILADWHPAQNNFRLSAGVVFNDNRIGLEGQPTETETIGGTTYTPAQIGTLNGDVVFDDTALYLGIGYGNAVGRHGNWSFAFDLGVMFQSYEVTLAADGLSSSLPGFQEDLKEEERKIQDDLDSLDLYPVVMVGVAYNF